jgi:Protein of unknown function (DUF3383)
MSDSISISITVSDKAPEKASFGIPLLAGHHTAWGERVKTFGDTSELLDEGLLATDPLYLMAQAVKSQDPSPPTFKIGRLEGTTYTHTFTLTPKKTTQGLTYTWNIDGTAGTYDVPGAATTTTIATAIAALIDPLAGVSASAAGGVITVTAAATNTVIAVSGLSEHLWLKDTTTITAGNLTTDLNEILDEDDSWYGLALELNCATAVTTAAAWTEANGKIYVPQLQDTEVTDAAVTNDVASTLVTTAQTRTCGIWHRSMAGIERADAAFLAVNLVLDPGTYTPSFKSLANITVDSLRKGAKTSLTNKKATRYTREHGQNVTKGGRTPSGRFFDVTRGIDWLKAEIEADVFFLLLNNPKVPFTNAGISLVKGAVEAALVRGRNAGLIADDSPITVTAPDITETAVIDRANRTLRDVNFTCRLAGALEGIFVNGTVSV